MEYVFMFIIFWFVMGCFTIMTVPKPSDKPLTFIWRKLLTWPIGWWFIYQDYRETRYDHTYQNVEKMFINMGMEKINDPNARVSRRVQRQ